MNGFIVIDPTSDVVIVDHEKNVRQDYGQEELAELEASIAENGVRVPIKVRIVDEEIHLYHGYRRWTAIQNLIARGIEVKAVNAEVVKSSLPEDEIFDHFISNSGKPLTDVEKAEGLKKLRNLGYEAQEISKKTGINYQTILALINFAEQATKELKNMVEAGEVNITAGIEIVRGAKKDVDAQKEIIAQVKEAKGKGAKITVAKVKEAVKSDSKTVTLSPKERFSAILDKMAEEYLVETEDYAILDRVFYALFRTETFNVEEVISQIKERV